MGQSMSLCGSRNRMPRSPSLSYNEQTQHPEALAPFYSHHVGSGKEERKDDHESAPADSTSSDYYCDRTPQQQQQRVVEQRAVDSDDEEDRAAPRLYTHTKLRRDKPCAQLSAFSSSSSLHSSPGSGSDHAYYTTDEESPLSSASSSSSLSAQASPPRAFTAAASTQSHSASHSITVGPHISVPHQRLVNSHPFTQHRIDVAQPRSDLHTEPARPLTTSASTSCLRYAQYISDSSDEEMLHHSRSYQQLQSASWQQQQQQQQVSQGSQIGRLTTTHSYSSSSLSLSITRPSSATSLSSASSSPDSAPSTSSRCPPSASSFSSSASLRQDSQPVVTHNAVINIRPNVSSISLNTARTFRTHRRPLALESPTPSPVPQSDVEDDSPLPLNSRSLFRAITGNPSSHSHASSSLGVVCFSGLLLDRQPVSPGSCPGTCLSILRSQRMTTV